jgi:DnaJ-class molecular chaperone
MIDRCSTCGGMGTLTDVDRNSYRPFTEVPCHACGGEGECEVLCPYCDNEVDDTGFCKRCNEVSVHITEPVQGDPLLGRTA